MIEDPVREAARMLDGNDLPAPSFLTDATLTRLACERLVRAGHSASTLLREAGLSPAVLNHPGSVGAMQQATLLELAARGLDDDLLGFHMARDIDGRVFGPLYYLLSSCSDLGEALDKQARFLPTVNRALRCRIDRFPSLVGFTVFMDGIDRALAGQEVAFWITFVVHMSRALTTLELAPAQIAFAQGAPVTAQEMRDYYRRDPVFDAGEDCVVFDEQVAALPLMRSDPYLNAFLTQFHEDRLLRDAGASNALTTRVSDALASLLAQGQAKLVTVAGEFGMSARTLGRRLADEGVSFRTILDGLRADLATRYVRDTTMPLSQVAWRLGYKDPSAFIVAFKRWTGKTPSALRRESRL